MFTDVAITRGPWPPVDRRAKNRGGGEKKVGENKESRKLVYATTSTTPNNGI